MTITERQMILKIRKEMIDLFRNRPRHTVDHSAYMDCIAILDRHLKDGQDKMALSGDRFLCYCDIGENKS